MMRLHQAKIINSEKNSQNPFRRFTMRFQKEPPSLLFNLPDFRRSRRITTTTLDAHS